jgi:hypothetical protein
MELIVAELQKALEARAPPVQSRPPLPSWWWWEVIIVTLLFILLFVVVSFFSSNKIEETRASFF